MNWRFCIKSTEKRALDLCCGSMNKVDGNSYGFGYGNSFGAGNSFGYGDGSSPQEWR